MSSRAARRRWQRREPRARGQDRREQQQPQRGRHQGRAHRRLRAQLAFERGAAAVWAARGARRRLLHTLHVSYNGVAIRRSPRPLTVCPHRAKDVARDSNDGHTALRPAPRDLGGRRGGRLAVWPALRSRATSLATRLAPTFSAPPSCPMVPPPCLRRRTRGWAIASKCHARLTVRQPTRGCRRLRRAAHSPARARAPKRPGA